MIAKAGFTFTLVFHYPLVFHNLRTSLHELLFPNKEDKFKYRLMYLYFILDIL